jgi:hypothetical protein
MANSMGSASFRFFEVRGVKASAAEGKSRGAVKVGRRDKHQKQRHGDPSRRIPAAVAPALLMTHVDMPPGTWNHTGISLRSCTEKNVRNGRCYLRSALAGRRRGYPVGFELEPGRRIQPRELVRKVEGHLLELAVSVLCVLADFGRIGEVLDPYNHR